MASIWSESCAIPRRERLTRDIETQVAVIGGGLAGVLTTYRLRQAGKQVVILEADRIASGQTRHTTAKITSQHGLIYHHLVDVLGVEKARQYGLANEAAIQAYRTIITSEGIDCGFEELPSYVYSHTSQPLREEAEAAALLGLPASFVPSIDLPVRAAGAVRFERQAQFHPLKFVRALARTLTIYEETPVLTVEDHRITTREGSVTAEQIIFACHFPFVNVPGFYFARMHQERSYVLALENAPRIDGMYLGIGKDGYSFRRAGHYLLFGGEGHRTGENSQGGRYQRLENKARALFPDSRVAARWSAQDCITPDRVPYIGRYAASTPDWYVATGFGKWGMTSSMVAALLLTDQLQGVEHPWTPVFAPDRYDKRVLPAMAKETGQAVKGLTRQLFQFPQEASGSLPAGHGGIVSLDGKKRGISKDSAGDESAVSIRCPHMGCQLEWNPDEHSWDCPCHGSRFDCHGRRLSGPAQEDICLEKR